MQAEQKGTPLTLEQIAAQVRLVRAVTPHGLGTPLACLLAADALIEADATIKGLRAAIYDANQEKRAWRQRAQTAERKADVSRRRAARSTSPGGEAALGIGRGSGDG